MYSFAFLGFFPPLAPTVVADEFADECILLWKFLCVPSSFELILDIHFFVTVKKSNGGTVRKHTIKKLNGDTKAAEASESAMVAKGDINQNHNALSNPPSAAVHDTSNLSESTIQAFRETLHYQPLSQSQSQSPIYDFVKSAQSNNNANDQTARIEGGEGPEKVDVVAASTAESNTLSNGVGRTDLELDNRALFQGISLKDFERHHKLMKEANVEKRRLLSTAIEKR